MSPRFGPHLELLVINKEHRKILVHLFPIKSPLPSQGVSLCTLYRANERVTDYFIHVSCLIPTHAGTDTQAATAHHECPVHAFTTVCTLHRSSSDAARYWSWCQTEVLVNVTRVGNYNPIARTTLYPA